MIKISTVIITKNVENDIQNCIESLQSVSDEIIIIDDYSTDSTDVICNKYEKVKFIKNKFINYSQQKNYGNQIAKYDYIMSIDSDEILSEELSKSILEIKKKSNYDYYIINRKTNYCGKWIKHCGWYPDKKMRIWKNSITKWKGNIHETIDYDTNKTSVLKGDLLHYSYKSISQHIEKINKYSNYNVDKLLDKNKKSNYLLIFFKPIIKFTSIFFIKLGFLDGFYGFVISSLSAFEVLLKYIKLKAKQKNITVKNIDI